VAIFGAESWTLLKDIANRWLLLKDRFYEECFGGIDVNEN
jgi:hypothetical protein